MLMINLIHIDRNNIISSIRSIDENLYPELLEYLSVNLPHQIINSCIDEWSFLFIKFIFDVDFMKYTQFISLVFLFESSNLDFSNISRVRRFYFIKHLIRNSNKCDDKVLAELGRFIINSILINNEERECFIRKMNHYIELKECTLCLREILHFAKLEYAHY